MAPPNFILCPEKGAPKTLVKWHSDPLNIMLHCAYHENNLSKQGKKFWAGQDLLQHQIFAIVQDFTTGQDLLWDKNFGVE